MSNRPSFDIAFLPSDWERWAKNFAESEKEFLERKIHGDDPLLQSIAIFIKKVAEKK
jgi:hypothetical protein